MLLARPGDRLLVLEQFPIDVVPMEHRIPAVVENEPDELISLDQHFPLAILKGFLLERMLEHLKYLKLEERLKWYIKAKTFLSFIKQKGSSEAFLTPAAEKTECGGKNSTFGRIFFSNLDNLRKEPIFPLTT